MKKKILIYAGIALACFLGGLAIAYVSHRFLIASPEPPVASAPSGTIVALPSVRSLATIPSEVASALSSSPASTVVSSALSGTTAPPAVLPRSAPSPTPSRPERGRDEGAGPGVDLVLLIDSSGSMKQTDPHGYRRDAAKLLVSLLSSSDRAGIMSFGDAVARLHPLTRADREHRATMFEAISRIGSRELTTNITDAVKQAAAALQLSAARQKCIVMLSDGRIDVGSKEKDAASLAELHTLLPELARSRIALHTVAFTEQSDSALLEAMARETGGSFRFAREDRDVHRMFAAVFEKIKAPDALPLEHGSFTVDGDIREATVLATKKAGGAVLLLDPKGGEHSAPKHAESISWFSSPVFDMITIQAPASGTWKVKLSAGDGDKVYIIANLSLATSFSRGFVGVAEAVPFELWLEKRDGGVTEQDLLRNTSFTAELAGPDGTAVKLDLVAAATGTAPVRPGRFTASFTCNSAGDHHLRLVARGKTFTRERIVGFKATERATQPSIPAAKPQVPAAKQGMSWTVVLLRLALINVVVAALSAGGYVLGKKLRSMRKKP